VEVRCIACGAQSLHELATYSELERVTSDTKPFASGGHLAVCETCGCTQKLADERWLHEIAGIYREYAMYAQSDGQEQAVFSASGIGTSRSDALLDALLDAIPSLAGPLETTSAHPDSGGAGPLAGSAPTGPTVGPSESDRKGSDEKGNGESHAKSPAPRWIDVGCGTGVTLRAASRRLSGWQFFGHDLDDRCLASLREIPRFVELFQGELGSAPHRFDLISLIHSLEHMTSPTAQLERLGALLEAGGRLLVQVPDLAANPFDLLVADHLSHFRDVDLFRVIVRAGLEPEVHPCGWLPKELSAVARAPRGPLPVLPDSNPGAARKRTEAWLGWLTRLLEAARSLTRSGPIGIFGTAIAGTWLFGALDGRVAFFVDEDPKRIGREHCGRPILGPDQIPATVPVYVPLVPKAATAIASRHGGVGARLTLPPSLPEPTADSTA